MRTTKTSRRACTNTSGAQFGSERKSHDLAATGTRCNHRPVVRAEAVHAFYPWPGCLWWSRAPSPGWFLVPYSLRWFVSLCRAILGLAIGHTREAVLMVRAEATAHAKRPGRLQIGRAACRESGGVRGSHVTCV